MVETGWVNWRKPVEKTSHLRPEVAPVGGFDKHYYLPETKLKMRCINCVQLFDNTFCDIGKCPRCNATFTKMQAMDMECEAIYHNVNYSGWTREVLDILAKYKGPHVWRPDGRVMPLNDVVRGVIFRYIAELRKPNKELSMKPDVYAMRCKALGYDLTQFQPKKLL